MSSNPVLDDDDILLIPAEGSNDKDTSSSVSRGSAYPRWTEDPNRLPIVITPRPVITSLPTLQAPTQLQGLEMQAGPRRTVIQINSGGQRGLYPPSVDPPVSFTGAYIASCVVYWCFCMALGGIAYAIAAVGENRAYDGDIAAATRWRNISFATSGVGVVLGIVLLVVIFAVILPFVNQNKGV